MIEGIHPERHKSKINLATPLVIYYVIAYLINRNSDNCWIIFNKNLCPYDLFLVAIVAVFGIGIIMNSIELKSDPMTKGLGVCDGIDYWSITHLGFYIALGYLFPDRYMFFFIISILWELFEHWCQKSEIYFCGKKLSGVEWMHGKMSDIAVNMAGYILGNYLVNGRLTPGKILSEFLG